MTPNHINLKGLTEKQQIAEAAVMAASMSAEARHASGLPVPDEVDLTAPIAPPEAEATGVQVSMWQVVKDAFRPENLIRSSGRFL